MDCIHGVHPILLSIKRRENMKNRVITIIGLVMLSLMFAPGKSYAQLWSFDVASIEALISDHRNVDTVIIARSGVETANQLLHKYSKEATVDYDSLNVKLDKYTKCFDIIDIIYNSGMTVMNVYTTTSDVTQRVGELEQLIEQFVNQCTARGNIVSSDTLIIGACRRCVNQVIDDGKSLGTSLAELAQYASGLRHMTTAELLIVIREINDALDSIRESVDHAYYVIWKYVTIRTHYFKRTLYNSKTVREMCNDAFGRWRNVTRKVRY